MYKPLPDSLTIKPSTISGLGVFACKAIPKDEDLGITHIFKLEFAYYFPQSVMRTPLGGFLNHSETPNCMIEKEYGIYLPYKIYLVIQNSRLNIFLSF
jgi:SET domain-containing protein